MAKQTINYREYLLEQLRDPEEAAAYLNAVLEDADEPVLMIALRDVVDSLGVSKVSKMAGLNRESLYRMLTEQGNPRLSSLAALLNALGLRLAVEVDQEITTVANNEKEVHVGIGSGIAYTTFETDIQYVSKNIGINQRQEFSEILNEYMESENGPLPIAA